MKVLLKVFNTNEEASDGSRIPKNVCEQYLLSEDYRTIISDKLALGGVTHKDRKLRQDLEGIIGKDDQILVNDNITHYISKLFFKDNDPFLYALIETFDPELFIGKRKENIINLIGSLKSGIKFPISVVIQARWNMRNIAEQIIRILGIDFTLNPAFEGAGTQKLMSNTLTPVNSLSGISEKMFSAEITIQEDSEPNAPSDNSEEILSHRDVIRRYGAFSEEAKIARFYSMIPKSKLEGLSNQLPGRTEVISKLKDSGLLSESDTSELISKFNNLIGEEDHGLIQTLIDGNRIRLTQILNSVPVDDPNHDQILENLLNEFLRSVPETFQFSTINSVRDRMYLNKYPRYSMIVRVVNSYTGYVESHSLLSERDLKYLKGLFIQDINLLIKTVQEKIMKGATLQSLFALSQFDTDLAKSGVDLSREYRKVLISEKVLGFIPEGRYKVWISKLTDFYNQFCLYVFGSIYSDTNKVSIIDKLQ